MKEPTLGRGNVLFSVQTVKLSLIGVMHQLSARNVLT